MSKWCCLLWFCCQPLFAQESLRVVTELSPPHQTVVNGEVAGLSTQLVREIMREAGLEANIEIYPWARTFRIASSQPNVLIYNMARTAEREKLFHWIGKVAAYQLGFVALTHRQDIQIKQLDDARRYTVAIQRDDLSARFLLEQGFSVGRELVYAADIAESWQLLLNGKVDLVIDDAVALGDMAASLSIAKDDVRFVYAIPELEVHSWLAANRQTPVRLVEQLQQAHARVAGSELYLQIMSSSY